MRRDRSMVVAAGYWMDESVIVWGSSRFWHRINKIDKYSRLPISTALAAFTAFVPLDHRHAFDFCGGQSAAHRCQPTFKRLSSAHTGRLAKLLPVS